MSAPCPLPDPTVGIAVRLTQFLDCQARVLGENGYWSFASGPIGSALLTAFLTILVALIGYRLILGARPGLQDGVGLTLRVGIALTLLGSWPAFQTLIFRTATDGPVEVAQAILGPSGLPSADLAGRVQLAYDTIRLGAAKATTGVTATAQSSGLEQRFQFQGAAPRTALAFLVGTVGLLSAVRICIGFLLAIGPLPVLSILLTGGRGLFAGWIRALSGAALAAVGATTVTAVELVLVESELARLQAFRTAASGEIIDPQALAAIVFTGLVMVLGTTLAAVRVASKIDFRSWIAAPQHSPAVSAVDSRTTLLASAAPLSQTAGGPSFREREMAQSLLMTVRREQAPQTRIASASNHGVPVDRPGAEPTIYPIAQSTGARRAQPRRTRTGQRREALR